MSSTMLFEELLLKRTNALPVRKYQQGPYLYTFHRDWNLHKLRLSIDL